MQNTMQKYDTQNMTQEEIRELRRSIMAAMTDDDWRRQMNRSVEYDLQPTSDAYVKTQKYDTQNMTKEELCELRRSIIASMTDDDWRKQMMRGYAPAVLEQKKAESAASDN
jgi:preprotein translocase subunit SecA